MVKGKPQLLCEKATSAGHEFADSVPAEYKTILKKKGKKIGREQRKKMIGSMIGKKKTRQENCWIIPRRPVQTNSPTLLH